MRWDRLFDDLEAQLAAQETAEREGQIADRTRAERASVGLTERLLAHRGRLVIARCGPAGAVSGTITEVGAGWVLLEASVGATLVLTSAVMSWTGLEPRSTRPSAVARGLGVGSALRVLSRDRAAVTIVDVSGTLVTGTVDAVRADHLDLAEHPLDEPRRPANVRGHRAVPFRVVAVVRRA